MFNLTDTTQAQGAGQGSTTPLAGAVGVQTGIQGAQTAFDLGLSMAQTERGFTRSLLLDNAREGQTNYETMVLMNNNLMKNDLQRTSNSFAAFKSTQSTLSNQSSY